MLKFSPVALSVINRFWCIINPATTSSIISWCFARGEAKSGFRFKIHQSTTAVVDQPSLSSFVMIHILADNTVLLNAQSNSIPLSGP